MTAVARPNPENATPADSATRQALSRHERVIAAFDFDGTITNSDSLRDFVRHTVGRSRFVAGAIRATPWLAAMLAGVCERGTAKARFLAATLGGMSQLELELAAQRYVDDQLHALIRPEMRARIEAHRRRGHELVLISASPTLYLKPWASTVGFDAVLATELAFEQGRFVGKLACPNCWGPEKVHRLRQWLGGDKPRWLYAYGDSRGDRELLALADRAWLRGSSGMFELDA